MNPVERVHDAWQLDRRVRILGRLIEPLLSQGARVLDVGAGDGRIAATLADSRPDLSIEGIDVLPRPAAKVPVSLFDGRHIPFEDSSFDTLLFVDVLHHADDPAALLAEGRRVARHHVVIKDHLLEGRLAAPTLRFMDRVGNLRHGVDVPHNYWREANWCTSWRRLGLTVNHFETRLRLYPPPLRWLFDRRLHFVARLAATDLEGADGVA